MEVGLLFTCRLGDVDLDRPVGEAQHPPPQQSPGCSALRFGWPACTL
jgi:hypothetical protein